MIEAGANERGRWGESHPLSDTYEQNLNKDNAHKCNNGGTLFVNTTAIVIKCALNYNCHPHIRRWPVLVAKGIPLN